MGNPIAIFISFQPICFFFILLCLFSTLWYFHFIAFTYLLEEWYILFYPQARAVRRDNSAKIDIPIVNLVEQVKDMLDNIQQNLFDVAKQKRDACIKTVRTWDEFIEALGQKKMILAPWCDEMVWKLIPHVLLWVVLVDTYHLINYLFLIQHYDSASALIINFVLSYTSTLLHMIQNVSSFLRCKGPWSWI